MCNRNAFYFRLLKLPCNSDSIEKRNGMSTRIQDIIPLSVLSNVN